MIASAFGQTLGQIGRRVTNTLAAGVLLFGLSAPAAQSEPLVLTPDGMVQMAVMLLDRGYPEQALRFADALLQRNPQDATALIVKARAERDMAQYPQSVATARVAWRAAALPRERYGAALAMAQGLASDGQRLRAQLWLRRAIQEAPNEAARSVAVRDLRHVRNRSRLSLRFDLSVRPSSNVNGGTYERMIEFFGIPLTISPDSRALSGGVVQTAVTAQYRIAESGSAKTDLRFGLVERRVWLSPSAKADAPMARSGTYAFSGYEVGLDQAWKLPALNGEATAAVSFGHNRYGGAPMSDYARLDLDVFRTFSSSLSGQAGVSLERQLRRDDPERSATIVGASAGLSQRLQSGDKVSVSFEARNTQSDADSIDHRALRTDLGWTKAKPVFGAGLSASLGIEARDYARSALSPTGREDVSLRARASLSLEKLDYMGFMPVISVEAERTRSNIALYRSQSLGVGVSIRSKF
ncbi:MAG: surface lipoprotein assembly modifier [Paracoccaceae bacterium]